MVRSALPTLLVLALPGVALAQDSSAVASAPGGLAEVELARSRQCVEVVARTAALQAELSPLADRSQRLLDVARAVAIEDPSAVAPLDETDATEAAVARWFERDQALARQLLEADDEAIRSERAAGRDEIKAVVNEAIAAVQAEAQARIDAAGPLTTEVGGCDGAILVRSAVLEACAAGTESPLCAAAAAESAEARQGFRFVDSPENLWDVQEMRPWTAPSPLTILPDGQLGGARTIGYARNGNLTLSLAFAPLLAERERLSPEEISRFEAVNDSLGFTFEHPQVAFTPALSLRTNAPRPLAGETLYVLHFDTPDSADVVWSGPAGAGEAVQATVPLLPVHLQRLGRGDPLRFTAVRQDDPAQPEGSVVYSIEFTSLNQARATQALMGYMAEGLSADVAQLVPPGGGGQGDRR